jgi:hypothetical protein
MDNLCFGCKRLFQCALDSLKEDSKEEYIKMLPLFLK